jgi:excisionase family DNA binding protein
MSASNEGASSFETNGRKYARKGGVASYLGVCPRTVDNWMASGVVPFIRVGRIVLFDLHEVEESLNKFKVAAKGSHHVRSLLKS